MRILHIYKDYFPVLGGIENYVRQVAEYQAGQGHEVTVLVTNPAFRTVREERAGVKIIKAASLFKAASTPLSLRLPLELLRRRYARLPPDIIHLHAPYPVGEMAWLLNSWLPGFGRKRPRTVMTYHSDVVRQRRLLTFYAPFLRLILTRLDGIIATSPNYIESSAFLRPVTAKCRVIPLSVEIDRFARTEPTKIAALRQRFAVQPDQILLLFTGRLRYYKGVQFLLEAMPQVLPQVRLLIIGVGPMEQTLREQVARHQLEERVTFLGEIGDSELADYYAASDIFVLPSCERSEAFGIVQLEAMAAGKPVISTELGTGTSYVNLNEQSGLVVPSADPPALAQAINQLATDPTQREKLGQGGLERVRAEFSLARMNQQLEKLYIELSLGSAS